MSWATWAGLGSTDNQQQAQDPTGEDIQSLSSNEGDNTDREMTTIEGYRPDLATTAGKQLSAIRKSLRTNKQWYNRWVKDVDEICGLIIENLANSKTIDELKEVYRKIKAKADEIYKQYDQFIEASAEFEDDANAQKEAIYQTFTKVRETYTRAVTTYNREMNVQEHRQPQPAAEGSKKVDETIRPDKLAADHKPQDLEMWLRDFETYFTCNGLDKVRVEQQRAHLNKCLDDGLKRLLAKKVDYTTGVYGQGGCIEALQQEFKHLYPMFARRREFFSMVPDSQEDFRHFIRRVREVGDTCELRELTEEQIYIYKYITSMNDEMLRQHLMTMGDKSLKEIEAFIDVYFENKRGKDLAQGSIRKTQDFQNKPKCKGCGQTNHSINSCQFKEDKCDSCGNKGHRKYHRVCPSFQSSKKGKQPKKYEGKARRAEENPSEQTAAPAQTTGTANRATTQGKSQFGILRAVKAYPVRAIQYSPPDSSTPTLVCDMIIRKQRVARRACLDTGATNSIISENIVRQINIPLTNLRPNPMYSITGQQMKTTGVVCIAARLNKTIEFRQILLTVCADTSEEVLIGFNDLKILGMLPHDWPNNIERGFDITRAVISNESMSRAKLSLFSEFSDVISDMMSQEPMNCPPMHVRLRSDITIVPRKVSTARRIPLHQEKEADFLVKDLLDKRVIIKVFDEHVIFVSPGMFVPKDSGKLRLVTDYTYVNQFIERPIHPFPSTREILEGIKPEWKVFIKMDCVHGYFQLPLDEESSFLTTFLLPSGKYRYLRGPMGLKPTNDEWCMRSDAVTEGVPDSKKMVDDILIGAEDLESAVEKARIILIKCREMNITISMRKFEISNEVIFAGHRIGENGIKPTEDRIKNIIEFPVPKSVKDIRSFLGLANQLAPFMPDLPHLTNNIRALLKKGNAFLWTEGQQIEFEKLKEVLTSDMVLKPFMRGLTTELLTDAAKLHGLGFALIQLDEKKTIRLISCGGTSLTETQKRYAVIELEALAIQHALEKCEYFLRGMPEFKVVTDHAPLVGVWKQPIAETTNPRLLRNRLKTVHFNFQIEWRAGKTHYIADALSRYPIFKPEIENYACDNMGIYFCRAILGRSPLQQILDSADLDEEYSRHLKNLKDESYEWESELNKNSEISAKIWPRLSTFDAKDGKELIVLDSAKIFVPKSARNVIIQGLHLGHPGINKMKQKAGDYYFWPKMHEDIERKVKQCAECAKFQASQQIVRPRTEQAQAPMTHVGIDLCHFKGTEYLVMVCRYSGWPFVCQLRSTTTDSITKHISGWFRTFGWASFIRTDGGPQFREKFTQYCVERNMQHELSSAYHAQSNGLAEAAVKNVKMILKKTGSFNEAFQDALCAFRNTPRAADGLSPAHLMFHRNLKEPGLPVHPDLLSLRAPEAQLPREQERKRTNEKLGGREYTPLAVGEQVLIQDTKTKEWSTEGRIISVRESEQSYIVQDTLGRTFIRNRRFLKPIQTQCATQNMSKPMPELQGDKSPAMGTALKTTVEASTFWSCQAPLAPSSTSWHLQPSQSGPTHGSEIARPGAGLFMAPPPTESSPGLDRLHRILAPEPSQVPIPTFGPIGTTSMADGIMTGLASVAQDLEAECQPTHMPWSRIRRTTQWPGARSHVAPPMEELQSPPTWMTCPPPVPDTPDRGWGNPRSNLVASTRRRAARMYYRHARTRYLQTLEHSYPTEASPSTQSSQAREWSPLRPRSTAWAHSGLEPAFSRPPPQEMKKTMTCEPEGWYTMVKGKNGWKAQPVPECKATF